jgi:hypothetical protein
MAHTKGKHHVQQRDSAEAGRSGVIICAFVLAVPVLLIPGPLVACSRSSKPASRRRTLRLAQCTRCDEQVWQVHYTTTNQYWPTFGVGGTMLRHTSWLGLGCRAVLLLLLA